MACTTFFFEEESFINYYPLPGNDNTCPIYTFLLNHSIYLKKPHQNPLSSFKDLSMGQTAGSDFVLYHAMIMMLL
jgi:hypothetical protein